MTDTVTAQRAQPPVERAGNIVAMASGKGGVGKTWLSISLCQALASEGRKTVLFDGDLGLANVDVQLGLMPDTDIRAAVDGALMLERVARNYDQGGFDILAGRSGSGALANVPAARLSHLTDQLQALAARKYDNIVIDLGAGVDRTVRQLAAIAGTVLVVTTDEPTSLTDAYAFIKLTASMPNPPQVRIIVNMAESEKEGRKTWETLARATKNFLKIEPPLAGIIRRDRHVRDCIRAQTPILTRSPSCDAAEDIMALAVKVMDITAK